MLLFSVVAESSNAITTRYQPSPGSSPGAGLKRFASSELLKIETAIGSGQIRPKPNGNARHALSFGFRRLVEVNGIEPMTSCLQSRRSPN
jgi:hypothetical protein